MNKAYVKYGDLAIDAPALFAAASDDAQPLSDMKNIVRSQPEESPKYASVLDLNQLVLNDGWSFIPEDMSIPLHASMGYVSSILCGASGRFGDTKPTLVLKSPRQATSPGLTLLFDAVSGCWATEIEIAWYRNGVLLDHATFYPDAVSYYAEHRVEGYDEARIQVNAWSLPRRFARINNVQFGNGFVIDNFLNISVRQEISPVSAQISINTLEFTTPLQPKSDFRFQRGQRLDAYFGDTIVGVFFVQGVDRLSESHYTVRAYDYTSILDSVDFPGGIYVDKSAQELVEEIMGKAYVPVQFEAYDVKLSGWLPYGSCRDSLAQVCFAAGVMCDTSFSDVVRIVNRKQTPTHVLDSGTIFLSNNKLTEIDPPSSVSLAAYTYYLGDETEDWSEIYSAEKSGEVGRITVIFSTAYENLSIENGEIVESGDNYAVIDAGYGCVLTGTPYFRTTISTVAIISKESTSKPLEITTPTLVTRNRVPRLMDALYNYYSNPYFVEMKTTNENVRCGDVVAIAKTYMGDLVGTVERMEYRLNGNKLFPRVSMSVKTTNLFEDYPRAGCYYAGEGGGLW